MRSGVPHKSGKNREAGENPARSRHCEDRRSNDDQSQETCLNAVAAFERPRKGVQAAPGILLRKRSRRYLSFFARQEGDGILLFRLKFLECAGRAKRRRRFGFVAAFVSARGNPKRRRATTTPARLPRWGPRLLAAALQIFVLALVMALEASCFRRSGPGFTPPNETHEVTDEAGRHVRVPRKIERVVSLAPNLTEIVYAVGAGEQLVGNTEYCDYPLQAKNVAKVGDTMHPSVERILALKPQIVLVSTASQLEAFTKQLDQQNIAVYVTNPQSLEDIFRSIQSLGDLFGRHDGAATLVAQLRRRTDAVEVATKTVKPLKVFYQVSDQPVYTIGRDAYLTDLVRRAGGISVTADVPGAFPRYSDEAALAARPEAIILPTGGSMGNANATVAAALKNSPAVLNNRVYRVNEDHLQRPGPRLIDGLEEMARALHPEAFK